MFHFQTKCGAHNSTVYSQRREPKERSMALYCHQMRWWERNYHKNLFFTFLRERNNFHTSHITQSFIFHYTCFLCVYVTVSIALSSIVAYNFNSSNILVSEKGLFLCFFIIILLHPLISFQLFDFLFCFQVKKVTTLFLGPVGFFCWSLIASTKLRNSFLFLVFPFCKFRFLWVSEENKKMGFCRKW